jgi:hypothetical protein
VSILWRTIAVISELIYISRHRQFATVPFAGRQAAMEKSGFVEGYDQLITIDVGGKNKKFVVHTSRLKESFPFFRACLDAPMKEALSGTVDLPEDDPAAFQELLDFAYRGSFRTKLSHEARAGDGSDIALVIRIRTFFLAEKMMAEEIQNVAIDTVIDPFEGRTFTPPVAVLSLLYDDERYTDRTHIQHLRDWTANELGCAIREQNQGWEGWVKDHPDVHAWLLSSPRHMDVIGRCAFFRFGRLGLLHDAAHKVSLLALTS